MRDPSEFSKDVDGHKVWLPETAEEYDKAVELAGPHDPVWDWEGWRKVQKETG